jgi:Domain of unknown function (DUF4189)
MGFSQPYSGRITRYGFGLMHVFPKVPMSRLSLALRLATLALTWLIPSEALAYYPCNGPGPGEVLIGVDTTNGVQTPLCEYVGEDGGDGGGYSDGGDPGGYWVEQFAALAWGKDANGAPTYSWYANATSMAEAENGALAQCRAAGDRDCVIGSSVANGAIAVAIDKTGTLHSDWGADAGEAKRKTLRYCKKQGGKGCKIEKIVESPAAWVSN